MPETSRLRRALNQAVGRARETGARLADRIRRGRAARRAVRGARGRSRGR
jgi:hypothetical protein